MNKTTKIALNYGVGLLVTVLLLWNLYSQVHRKGQLFTLPDLAAPATFGYGIAALLLLPMNLGVEARKWQLLAGTAISITFAQAARSMIGGIAFSFITPNRIGEYPGRILLLEQHNSTRLISVSVLGGCAQLLAVLLFGMLGLVYYYTQHPGIWVLVTLVANAVCTLLVIAFYWRFERWAPYLERVRWLQRFHMYARLLRRFTGREQLLILGMSVFRFAIYSLQFYFVLRWMGVDVPLWAGFCCCVLFFWAMAVIPSIALAELGIRGQVGLFLFGTFSTNAAGIFYATIGLWCINLAVPALIGAVLLLRLKLLR